MDGFICVFLNCVHGFIFFLFASWYTNEYRSLFCFPISVQMNVLLHESNQIEKKKMINKMCFDLSPYDHKKKSIYCTRM